MTADDAYLFRFDREMTDASLIECPECKGVSPLSEWTESEVYCEDCGEHRAMKCPKCEERHDHVWARLKVAD